MRIQGFRTPLISECQKLGSVRPGQAKLPIILALLAVSMIWLPRISRAEEISRPITLWPLVYHEADQEHAETEIIWPLLHYERKKTWTRYALRPIIFSTEKDPVKDYRKTSVLWPLSIYKREGPELSFHMFPLYWYKKAPERHYNVLFPVYWDIKSKDRSYFHIWPLFGVNRRGEYFTEYSTLYPFLRYGSDSVSGETDINAPWPLINYHRKGDYLTHRFLPVYWYEGEPEKSRGFALLYFWNNGTDSVSRGIFPLWFSQRGGDRSTDLVFPLYFNRETPQERLRFITPLYFSNKNADSSTDLFFPLYLRHESPTYETKTTFFLPVYFANERRNAETTIVLPLYFKNRYDAYTFTTLFPLYYHSEDTQEKTEMTYYFPVYGTYKRGDTVSRHYILFPLYARARDEGLQLESFDLLWPLVHYESSPTTGSMRILPLYWHDRTPTHEFTVGFPLYWDITSGEKSYFHVVPFYGIHTEGDWYVKRFFIGPLFMDTRDSRAGLSEQDALFFLYSRRQEGEKKRSWLIPFYLSRSDPGSEFTYGAMFLFLPPYYLKNRHDDYDLFHVWPFYGYNRDGSYSERDFIWPLFRFGNDPEKDESMTHVLLYYHKRTKEDSLTTLVPLWLQRKKGSSTLDATPFLHWHEHDAAKDTTDLSFLWLVPPKISLIRYHHEPDIVSHAFFPLYSYSRNSGTGALDWSFIWPLFSYSSHGEFEQETGFLWKVVYFERKDAETSEFRFLWRFIRRSTTATSYTFEFNPFYYYDEEKGKGSYWAVLGGLIGMETTAEQKKKLRLFWIF